MKRWLLALALFLGAGSLHAQDLRVGWCYLNVGQIVAEPDYHVRSGSMGNENACFSGDVRVWGRLSAGAMVAITKMYVFPAQEGGISRWSWRPHGLLHENDFVWIHPNLSFPIDPASFLEVRPSIGVWWPANTGARWGAPVGVSPSVGLDASLRWGRVGITARGWWVRKGTEGWTVLHDWATEGPIQREARTLWPVAIGLSLWH